MQTKTGRASGLLVTGLAAAAVAGVMIATATFAGTGDAAVAGTPGAAVPVQQAVPQQAAGAAGPNQVKSTPKATKYVFQNRRPAVGTVPDGGEVKLADHLYFATRGTQWAVISRQPGEPEYEPFGWRSTVGNDNLGDATSPGVQSVGAVQSSVFKSDQVSTVVYTLGTRAWYAKMYRLAGIPGWVQSSVELTGGKATTAGPDGPRVSVFAYDATGELLARFGTAKGDPLA